MKTIVQLIETLNDGGAETLVKNYAILGKKMKINTCIVSLYPTKYSANYKRLQEAEIKTRYVYKKWNIVTRAFNKMFGSIYIPFRLKNILKEINPEAIHIHLNMLSYVASIRTSLSGMKLLYTCHSPAPIFFPSKTCREFKACKQLITDNNLQLIALHEEMRIELDSLFEVSNTVVVHNGIIFKDFEKSNEVRNNIRRQWNIAEDAFLIGHVGRFADVKNHKKILDVFYECKKRDDRAMLLLIGNGPLQNEVESVIDKLNISNSVIILSHRKDVNQLMQAMDVFLFPSLYEGLSITLVEAQAVGLRCVISTSINTENILLPSTVAISLDETDQIWADYVMNNSVTCDNYGELDNYNIEKSFPDLLQLYGV